MKSLLSHNYFFLLPCCFILLLASCASYSEKEQSDPPYVEKVLDSFDEANVGEFLRKIISENTVSSFSLIEKFYESTVIDQNERNELWKLAEDALSSSYEQNLEAKNYETALLQYRNLEQLGIEPGTEGIKVVYEQLLQQSTEKKQYPTFSHYAEKVYVEHPELFYRESTIKQLITAMEQFPDISLITLLCDDSKALALIAELENETAICSQNLAPKSIAELLESTFVVTLDEGITVTDRGPEFSGTLGSAFFISREGHALTNYHVIKSQVDPEYEGKSEMKVRLQQNDFKARPAKVLSYDALLDIALIKVPYKPEHVIPISEETVINEGDAVIAIGSPIGLTNSVSSGIISAKNRRLLDLGGVIQIDAPINQGNSGGPLINASNELAGVVFSKIQEFENLNFAIPASMVTSILPALFASDKVEHSWLGIGTTKVNEGFYVLYITPNSPAEKSNIRMGDIITHINGVESGKISKAQEFFLDIPLNSLLTLRLKRGERELEVTSYTAVRNEDPFSAYIRNSALYKIFPILIGAHIEVTRFGSRPTYRIQEVFEDSYAEFLGITEGDIITVLLARQQKKTLHLVLIILQQSRGYTTDSLQLSMELSTRNFI